MNIRPVRPDDRADWLRMRAALWPDDGDVQTEVDAFLGGDRKSAMLDAVFVAEGSDGDVVGFAEATIRPFADACEEAPCAYLEGLWVNEAERRTGVARALVDAVETWARGRGFSELGSDYESDNLESAGWHAAHGFEVVERLVVVRKLL